MDGQIQSLGWSPTIQRMVTNQKEVYLEFDTVTELAKLTSGDNCHGWSATIPRMVAHHPKDGHPPEGTVLQTWNSALKLNSQNEVQVTTSMDGHLPF